MRPACGHVKQNESDLASHYKVQSCDLSVANSFKLFIWKKYAFIIVFLITAKKKKKKIDKGMPQREG